MALDDVMPDPVLVLPDMESVRAAVTDKLGDRIGLNGPTRWELASDLDRYRIRSEWVISLIGEVVERERRSFAYNSEVKALAAERLGVSLTTDQIHGEGDTLSLLIYNAQRYCRSDVEKARQARLVAEGWTIRPSEAWLAERVGKRFEVLGVVGSARVDRWGEKVVLCPPRSRVKSYNLSTIVVRET